MKPSKTLAFLILQLILLSSISTCFAAAKNWTGSISTNWSDANNWSPASIPGSGDDIVISNVGSGNYPILSTGSYDINTLEIRSTANLNINSGILNVSSQITLENGGTLTQNSGLLTTEKIVIQSTGVFNQLGGTLKVNAKFANEGTFTSIGGTIHFTGSGDGGSDFATGLTQFFNLVIDDGAHPMFDNDVGDIKIAGDFTNNNPDLDVTDATFTFNGSGDQTIYSASSPLPGTTTFGNLVIDKSSGTIQMLSDVAVENTFTEENGTLDHNGNIFWVGGTPNPVELSSFSAVILENGINLKWRTETEVNNYGFNILCQSAKGGQDDEWTAIGFVDGHGNSNSPKDYSFVDENASDGKYYYRLKQIDTDGKYEYSKTIEIDFGSPMNYEMSQNYPNPFNPSTTIRFSVQESSFINLSIYNSLGEKVEELVNEVKEPGIHTVEFNAESAAGQLASGTYIYRLQANDFTQIKKMILVK